MSGCTKTPYRLTSHFSNDLVPPTPNYAEEKNWAALPHKSDPADLVPYKSSFVDLQKEAKVDVFFIHPTIFTSKPQNQYQWNADILDNTMNQAIDQSTILNQASVFNGSCSIYAPRYRQAHYHAFITQDLSDKERSLAIAYADVKAAFEYYLKHYNNGRPIVIASHSQGTVHAKKLLKEFFDRKELKQKLVAAYLVGIATQPDTFYEIPACKSGDETGCFVSWNTYARGYYPSWYNEGINTAISTNPLTWRLDEDFASKEFSKGGVGLKFTFFPQAVDAQNHAGLLWINKPYVKGRALIHTKIWHRADYNLFYGNIRDNIAQRVKWYLKTRK